MVPTTNSAGLFTLAYHTLSSLKKSELNSTLRVERTSYPEETKASARMPMASGSLGGISFQLGTWTSSATKKVVQMPGYELGRGRLTHDDVYNVLAVERPVVT